MSISAPAVGKTAPVLDLPATNNTNLNTTSLNGSNFILYFYPKDNTSGCTLEGQNFRDLHSEFRAANTHIYGISRDSITMHADFRAAQAFPFDLLSDENEAACKAYDVIQLKNKNGEQVLGIERSTFLIDKDGVLQSEWRKVSVAGHAKEVLKAAQALNNSQSH
ncbi:MAG: peroxiredoxin [Gammaproteobacteria bacterium]|nr:peroxiredoxin [Gammaproteobacteria bacterium]